MNLTKCDFCEAEKPTGNWIWITVKLLPTFDQQASQGEVLDVRDKHFCGDGCFWNWIEKNKPK